ncbi:sulfotransferase [Ekhidna sp.]|uniref:sulfotransferase n=1 Tax=Ekhidna sp. TaxID=2608089 RepID=UPI003B5CA93F
MKIGSLKPPILIIGMHRSGTTMISKYLDSIGIWSGPFKRKDVNNESRFFIKLNDWLLRETNASWDNPYNFKFIDESAQERLSLDVERYLNRFLGFRFFLGKNPFSSTFLWGWKDPRTTITYSIWKKLFPKMKVVIVVRNPFDVANSLYVRNTKLKHNKIGFIKKIRRFFLFGRIGYQQSTRMNELEEGIKLWMQYNECVVQIHQEMEENCLMFKYEDFLDDPRDHLKRINSFLNVEDKTETINEFISRLKHDRKNSFLKNEKLRGLFEKYKTYPLVKYFGYDEVEK